MLCYVMGLYSHQLSLSQGKNMQLYSVPSSQHPITQQPTLKRRQAREYLRLVADPFVVCPTTKTLRPTLTSEVKRLALREDPLTADLTSDL